MGWKGDIIMDEYINREMARTNVLRLRFKGKNLDGYEQSFNDGVEMAAEKIKRLPATDVCSVKYSAWIVEAPDAAGYFPIRCGNCGCEAVKTGDPADWINTSDHSFCSACGVKMNRRSRQ